MLRFPLPMASSKCSVLALPSGTGLLRTISPTSLTVMLIVATPPLFLLLACYKRFIFFILTAVLLLIGTAGAKETAPKPDAPPQGVELLFPAGTGKQAKDAKLSKEQKKAAVLLQKLKAIEEGGDVNAVDKLGQTALMHAAAQGNQLAVCWLVAKGADAAIKSKKGKTASSVAHGDMVDFLAALEKEKQPLSRQEARDMYACMITCWDSPRRITPGEYAILMLRGAKAKGFNQLEMYHKAMDSWAIEDPMKLAIRYRTGARKFSFPEDLSKANAELLQLLRALGVKEDATTPVRQMNIALQLKQKATVLALLKQDSSLLQNPEIFSSISDAKTLQALLDAGLDAKNEKLMEAVINEGDVAMLRTLLKAGATIQDPDKILEKATKQASASFILALIDAGAKADVNTLPVEVSSVAPGSTVFWGFTLYNDQAVAYRNSATLLHQAAKEVNLRDVKLLLARGANPNIPGKKAKDNQEEPYGMTPLMAAASSATRKNAAHRTEIVKRLLDAGADVHAKDSAGNGVIYYAVCGGSSIGTVNKKAEADILSMVEVLLKAEADVPKDILAQGALRPEISPAGREKLALMLLDAGADPLAKSESGKTTLMVNGIGVPKIAKRLLDAGADVHAKDSEGKGVIYYVIDGGLWNPDPYVYTQEGEPVSGSKREEADILRIVELLLKAGADVPKDILAQKWLKLEISPAGREKLALMLLDAGADPLAKSENKETNGWTTLMVNGIGSPELAKRLLDAGVDPSVKCGETSAMSLAMGKGAVEVVKLLKEKGIAPGELQLMNPLDDKPLLPEKIEPLLKLGARIPKDMTNRLLGNMTGGHVSSPLLPYEDYVDIIQILKKHGYKPELMAWAKKGHSDWHDFNTEVLRAFFKTGENPNEVDESGNSLLANFVSSAHVYEYDKHRIADVLHAFIEAGVDLNLKNKDGKTILQLAKEKELGDELGDDVIKLLKEHGAKE